MAKLLACSEQEDVNDSDYVYYESIRLAFIKRHHQIELTTCAQAWDELARAPVDVLLMFVHSKQSCCWDLARRVRNEWAFDYEQPEFLMIIERSPADDPHIEYPTDVNDPEMAEWYDFTGIPAYFLESEYLEELKFLYARTFKKSARSIIAGVETLLFGRHFDRQQFEGQIATLFPGPKDRWSWTKRRRLYHPMFELKIHQPEPEQTLTVVWSWENKIWIVDTWGKFLQFIEDERLSLADERDREDILTIFSHFQQRNFLREVDQPNQKLQVPDWKKALLAQYALIVHPPTYTQVEDEHQVCCWALDRANGNLEKWLFTQHGQDFKAQSWVKDEGFSRKFKGMRCFSGYGIPPSFALP